MEREGRFGAGRVPHGGREAQTLIDFSTNQNPRRPDGIARIYESAFAILRSYPPEPYDEFRVAAGEFVGCEPRDVLPTAGSVAGIRLAVLTTIEPGDTALVPYPSYSEYAREIRLRGGKPVSVPHDEILDADPRDHELAVVCNPNNPTGDAYDVTAVASFAERCRAQDTTLLVDETYLDFTGEPSMAGVDGAIVVRSLNTIFGLPGLRMGFAVATGALREALWNARAPWNVSAPAVDVAIHCMRDTEFVTETRQFLARERPRLARELATDYDVAPSAAPFLLIDVGDRYVDDVVRHARDNGCVVRDATTFRGLDSHIRVGIRAPSKNDTLVDALTSY